MEGAYPVLIQNYDELLATAMEGKLSNKSSAWSFKNHCIGRVHQKLREVNESAYEPVIVSIGPFHRGKKGLQVVEEYKWCYLRELISRRSGLTLQVCIMAIRELEGKARKCYTESIALDSNHFVEMMILDGCFIIETFFRHINRSFRDDDDFLQNTAWRFYNLRRDLLLIENQIPFFILECLFGLTVVPEVREYTLSELALYCLNDRTPGDLDSEVNIWIYGKNPIDDFSNLKGVHLLDLIRESFLPPNTEKCYNNNVVDVKYVHSLTELQEAGIEVKVNQNSRLVGIKFKDGVLEIPHLIVEDISEPLFRNLIAYEQLFDVYGMFITDYIAFMDSLINTSNDVCLLHGCGVIENCLGDDEEAAMLFNKLGRGISINQEIFHYTQICKEVNVFYKTRWHMWKASLRRNYANTPWAILSLIGAIVLLILTFLQTVFTIRG